MPSATPVHILEEVEVKAPLLEERFTTLKKSLVRPEHKQKVIESWGRLLKVLESEVQRIQKHGPVSVPEIDFNDVRKNGGALPEDFANIVRDRGCVILRNVVPVEQAEAWEAELKDYTQRHPGVGGYPPEKPASWSLWWTRPQTQIRSHPQVMEAMKCVSQLWHVTDPSTPIDFDSQVVYPDRLRIRYPSKDGEYTLAAHLDSGSTERWEDSEYRANYQAIFEGNWQDWDGWSADRRIDAKSDLYDTGTSCSCWRSLQGWLSLSHTGTGEGTLRLLPNLKASVAYMMLRPLFLSGEFDDSQPTFPGAVPGKNQFYPTQEFHPHLGIEKGIVGIPPVKPGDYVFWHCDLVHEVDRFHPGERDSSVVYNACNPLTPYNVASLVKTRESFLKVEVPQDFRTFEHALEREYQHEDNGAKRENILSAAGLQALGLTKFDDAEEGLTPGQREIRRLANAQLGFA
ncbi:DUF1479-domain-containing protein [Thozetella sp. PMI_491]|nr:DUF1479-domain-containing protein [Thozetella sp. PMI_491]